jgi:hypothetical protein
LRRNYIGDCSSSKLKKIKPEFKYGINNKENLMILNQHDAGCKLVRVIGRIFVVVRNRNYYFCIHMSDENDRLHKSEQERKQGSGTFL